jgi:hypothetical protein
MTVSMLTIGSQLASEAAAAGPTVGLAVAEMPTGAIEA